MLDGYFEGIAAIVIAHGGMVDKIVGDAVHALFNAPVDLDDHPRRAVDCAVAIRAWSKEYQRSPEPAALRFGRTRVGVETGSAVVGDVGIKAKLDYTAHGDAINVTARLEAANKELGSTICVGPTAAARCDPMLLRPLGVIAVRGRDGAARGVRAVAGRRAGGVARTLSAGVSVDRKRPRRRHRDVRDAGRRRRRRSGAAADGGAVARERLMPTGIVGRALAR